MTSPEHFLDGDKSKASENEIAIKMLADSDHSSINGKSVGHDLISNTVDEAALLAEGFVHGALEHPYNGAIQFANHIAGTHLPEIHLVDAAKVENSLAGKIGTAAGDLLNFSAAALATGGCSSAIRMGLLGAVDAGIFYPSDANSNSFFTDRLSGAGIGMMAGAAAGVFGFTPTELKNVYDSVGLSPTGWAFSVALRAISAVVE